MQDIEPFFNWRHLYTAEEDKKSPFYGNTYSEFEYSQKVYNFYIHPQWDDCGIENMFVKILFTDYEEKYTIIELIGEWNDAVTNDISILRKELADKLEDEGITKFIFIAENVLNFYSSDDCYYEDWSSRLQDEEGWIMVLNLPEQSFYEFKANQITRYVFFENIENWRTKTPDQLFAMVEERIFSSKRLL